MNKALIKTKRLYLLRYRRFLFITILFISGSLFGQDSTTIKLLNNIISLQEKEIERQDKVIMLLTDSLIGKDNKIFVLSNLNSTLKKKTSRNEIVFKIFGFALQGLNIYVTSKR